jgi:endonuclease/exonuclease/phosphatase family metal-dependent hydrolase
MAFSLRKLSKRFFLIANIGVAAVFLLACMQPWLNPETFWVISFLSLTLPYLLLVLLAFFVFWLFMKWRYIAISLVAMLIGFKQIGVLFGTHREPFVVNHASPAQLRVLTWNVKGFLGIGRLTDEQRRQIANGILELLFTYRPDVICLQEFGQKDKPEPQDDIIQRLKDAGYHYHVFSRDYSRARFGYSSGIAIFSKFKMVAKKRIQFTSSPESLLYADVKFGNDTLRVFTSHLQSFKLIDRDFDRLEEATQTGDNLWWASRNIFSKMKTAFRNRGAQADQIRPFLDDTRYPEIFCGDLNDVPGSYAYWQMRGTHRLDAHLEKGWGIGRTFTHLAPSLRIDHIFADPALKVMQYDIVQLGTPLSDHLPIVADLQLQ